MQHLLSLNSSSNVEKICELTNNVCSISFCNTLGLIFFSDIELNSIFVVDLSGKIALWRNDGILNPKSICMDENHKRMFYEDNENIFVGCWLNNKNYFDVLARPSREWFKPLHTKRTYSLEKFQRMRHFCFCDKLKNIISTIGNKNIVVVIDNSGNHRKLIGSGRQEFSMSPDCFLVSMNNPTGIAYLSSKLIVVSDTNNHVLRIFDLKDKIKENGVIGVPLSDGIKDDNFTKAKFRFPSEMCSFKNTLYVVDGEENNRVRKINMDNKKVETAYETKNSISSISCSSDKLFLLEQTNES